MWWICLISHSLQWLGNVDRSVTAFMKRQNVTKLSMNVSGWSGCPQPQLSFSSEESPLPATVQLKQIACCWNSSPFEGLKLRLSAFSVSLAICMCTSSNSNVWYVLRYPAIKANSSYSGLLLAQPHWECVYPVVKADAPKYMHSLALYRLDQKLASSWRSVLTTNIPGNFYSFTKASQACLESEMSSIPP